MTKKLFAILFALVAIGWLLIGTGCSFKVDFEGLSDPYHAPRLVVRGTVTNSESTPLAGIYVAIYGVREAHEKDLLTYNYAITDTAGRYTIVRYRGRELPKEVTVVATDSTGIYQEQTLFVPIQYDSIRTPESGYSPQPHNGFATADFVLLP